MFPLFPLLMHIRPKKHARPNARRRLATSLLLYEERKKTSPSLETRSRPERKKEKKEKMIFPYSSFSGWLKKKELIRPDTHCTALQRCIFSRPHGTEPQRRTTNQHSPMQWLVTSTILCTHFAPAKLPSSSPPNGFADSVRLLSGWMTKR